MRNLSAIGRIFFGVAVAEMGLQALYFVNFPYMLLPPANVRIPDALAYVLGIILAVAGTCIVFMKKNQPIALVLGSIFVVIACFFLVPYELVADSNRMHLGAWENAKKTLALAGGAFAMIGCSSEENENPIAGFWGKLARSGSIAYGLMIIGFSILHFVYAKQASGYVPSYIPFHLFWMYFCGVALLGSGIAIVFRIKTRLIATLLGLMIFTWFVSLHIPKVIGAAPADLADEISSAFLALAYSGTAFVIAGTTRRAH
ncbi:MAG: hypothetical protein JSU01_01375 [Bacteroidetes bacterium]|nr:hypothetical protein [Bacteroidota bacterium]